MSTVVSSNAKKTVCSGQAQRKEGGDLEEKRVAFSRRRTDGECWGARCLKLIGQPLRKVPAGRAEVEQRRDLYEENTGGLF